MSATAPVAPPPERIAMPPIEAEVRVRHALARVAGNAVARDLAGVCAYLAPDRIPRDLLLGWAAVSGVSATDVDSAVELLLGRALLTAGAEGTVGMHRLVQRAVRDAGDPEARERAAAGAVRLLEAALPRTPWEPDCWPACQRLRAHALCAAEHAERSGAAPRQTARVLARVGQYHEARADPAGAAGLLERALAIKLAVLGPDHAQIAITLGNLGIVRQQLGELDAAHAAHERALAILQVAYGHEHRDVAIALGNLGSVQQELGELDAACASLLRALAIKEVVHGPAHPDVALALENLKRVQQQIAVCEAARSIRPRARAPRDTTSQLVPTPSVA